MDTQEPERKKATLGRWEPKEWKPEYDRVVAFSFLGTSNIAIADKTGFTKEHVSNILTSEKGKEVMAALQTKQRDHIEVNIGEEMNEIAQNFTRKLKDISTNQELFEKSPFAVINVGLRVLEGTRHLKDPNAGQAAGVTNNFWNLPEDISKRLIEGLVKSDKVAEKHQGDLNRDISGISGAGLIEAPKKSSEDAA